MIVERQKNPIPFFIQAGSVKILPAMPKVKAQVPALLRKLRACQSAGHGEIPGKKRKTELEEYGKPNFVQQIYHLWNQEDSGHYSLLLRFFLFRYGFPPKLPNVITEELKSNILLGQPNESYTIERTQVGH
jgi:hypothetical protein